MEIFAEKHNHVLQILRRYTTSMVRFSDVVRYDLIADGGMEPLHP